MKYSYNPRPADARRKVRDDNFAKLASLANHWIILKSNKYPDASREYFVESVRESTAFSGDSRIPAAVLENRREDNPPTINFPEGEINWIEKDGMRCLHIVYQRLLDVERDFKSLKRDVLPDLEIFIYVKP